MDVSKPLLEGHKDYLDDVDTFSIKKKYQDRTCTSRMCQNCMQPWAILKDSDWFCWRFFVMETKIRDYDDFASSEQIGEIYYLRQKSRERFDYSHAEDKEMVEQLWSALFPTLPYEGRVNQRWREVGFQNDDLTTDFRSSGRLGLRMLVYFAEYRSKDFQRMIREDYFPVCCGALNILETLLIHLRLKDPLPLMCPCCGTENAEKETSLGGRSCPELMGFLALLNVDPSSPNQHRLQFQWPIEAALSQVFVRSMLLLEAIWKHKFHQDSSMNLLHFREALYDTRIEIMNSLARSKEFDTYKKTYTGRASSVRSTASIGSSIP